MTDPRLVDVLRFYDRLLDTESEDARVVGWRSSETQRRNFRALAQLFAAETEAFSVYDVGCGLGNMRSFLEQAWPQAVYSGCDIHPRMIERARLRDGLIDVELRNILEKPPAKQYDYVVASGTFSHCDVPQAEWSVYVRQMLRTMFDLSRKGIGVIFLSTTAEIRERGDYHESASQILQFAQAELSRLVEVRHAFSPWTFAFFAYKNDTFA